MKKRTILFLVVMLWGLSACTPPTSNTPVLTTSPAAPVVSVEVPATTGLNLTKPGAVLKALKVGEVTLPKSLQDGSTNVEARSARSLTGRALNDVTTLTSLNLPSLKAQGYNEFKNSIEQPSMVKVFLDALKAVPAIANDTLELNTVIDTGTITMGQGSQGYTIANSGRLKTELTSDGSTLLIFWSLSYPDPNNSDYSKYPTYQATLDAAPRIVINLYIRVNKAGIAEMYAYRALDAAGKYMNYWTQYDPSTKESIDATDNNWGSGPSTSVNLVKPQTDGSFFLLRKADSADYNQLKLGYADDQFGGIASTGSNTYDNDGSGPNPSESHPYISVEFYDGTGDLVYQGWGDSASNSSRWSWLTQYANNKPTNLYTANINGNRTKPNTFKLKTIFGTTKSYKISYDGTTWVDFTPDADFAGWCVVYHNNTKDVTTTSWNLQPGDAVYWTSSWSSNSEGSNWVTEQSYYKGYEVPVAETFFGKGYYLNKSYPLKNLLPLKEQYAVGYDIKQKEGVTWYNWQDMSGNWKNGATAPAAGTYQYLNSWVNYSYWLENKNYKDSISGLNDNLATTNDSLKGDVQVQLNDMEVWYWDQATGKSLTRKSPAFSTYQADLPPYFSFDAVKAAAVVSTKAKLEDYYANRGNYTAASYLEGFQTKISAVLPSFPSMVGYPGYTGN